MHNWKVGKYYFSGFADDDRSKLQLPCYQSSFLLSLLILLSVLNFLLTIYSKRYNNQKHYLEWKIYLSNKEAIQIYAYKKSLPLDSEERQGDWVKVQITDALIC